MLRQSTQHMSGPLDYVVVRPVRVQYTSRPGDIRDLDVGYVIPGEVAEAWENRALNNLIWVGRLVPVPRGSQAGTAGDGAPVLERLSDDDLDGLERQLAAERQRRVDNPPAPVEEPPSWPQQLKGGYFQLSDGSKVRGKNKALAAQAALAAAAKSEA